MATDLKEINRRLARRTWGGNAEELLRYLDQVPVCIARLAVNVEDLRDVLTRSRPLRVVGAKEKVNADDDLGRHYLQYLRLASKDVHAGALDRLIETGLCLADAGFFAYIEIDDIRILAATLGDRLFNVRREEVECGYKLPAAAARQHALAAWT